MARYDSPPKTELQRASVPFKHEKQMLFYTAFITIIFFINPPYLLIFLRPTMHKGSQCTWNSCQASQHVQIPKRNSFTGEGGSLIAPLWHFYGGVEMAGQLKREPERKLTETECNKIPWVQHVHQFRKHMEQRATSDMHVSHCDQRDTARSGQNGSRICPPYCGWNRTAHDSSMNSSQLFQTSTRGLWLNCDVCGSNGHETLQTLLKLKLDFHYSDLRIWLLMLDCLDGFQPPPWKNCITEMYSTICCPFPDL